MLTFSNFLSLQRLLLSTVLRRSPCSVESVPTGQRAARCATTPSASHPTSSPSETRMLPSLSPAVCSSRRGSTLDTKVFVILLPLCICEQLRKDVLVCLCKQQSTKKLQRVAGLLRVQLKKYTHDFWNGESLIFVWFSLFGIMRKTTITQLQICQG